MRVFIYTLQKNCVFKENSYEFFIIIDLKHFFKFTYYLKIFFVGIIQTSFFYTILSKMYGNHLNEVAE